MSFIQAPVFRVFLMERSLSDEATMCKSKEHNTMSPSDQTIYVSACLLLSGSIACSDRLRLASHRHLFVCLGFGFERSSQPFCNSWCVFKASRSRVTMMTRETKRLFKCAIGWHVDGILLMKTAQHGNDSAPPGGCLGSMTCQFYLAFTHIQIV